MTGEEFDVWMREHGWSNRRLATELEVHYVTVARWRLGEQPVPRIAELALKGLERRRGRYGRA